MAITKTRSLLDGYVIGSYLDQYLQHKCAKDLKRSRHYLMARLKEICKSAMGEKMYYKGYDIRVTYRVEVSKKNDGSDGR